MQYFQDGLVWLLYLFRWTGCYIFEVDSLLHFLKYFVVFSVSELEWLVPTLGRALTFPALRTEEKRHDAATEQPTSSTDFPHKTAPSPADQMLEFGQLETRCSEGASRCTSPESIFQVFFGYFRAFLGDV